MGICKFSNMSSERQIEATLVATIRHAGGRAYKFSSPARRGVPDRLCVLPGTRVLFVECKRPGQAPTTLQARELSYLRGLGFDCRVIDSMDGARGVLG